MFKKMTAVIAAVCLAVSLSAETRAGSGKCLAPHYQIVELPLLPSRLNDLSEVIGTTEDHKAATWSERKGLREIPPPSGFTAVEITGLSNSGQMAGTAISNAIHRAFTYENGDFNFLPGEQAKALWLNDSKQAVGESLFRGKSSTQPILWKNHTALALGACCGGTAKAVNNRGQVIGDVYDPQARYHAFLWTRKNGLRQIAPSFSFSSAIAINNSGHIVVQAGSDGVFLYVDGILTPLRLSGKQPASPRAINDCDGIVGAYGPFSDAERAFAWEKTNGFVDLNDRLEANSGWKLEMAIGINNKGEIIGWGDQGKENVGFLLIPKW